MSYVRSGLEQYSSTKTVIVPRSMLLSMRLKQAQLKNFLPTRKTRSQLDKISLKWSLGDHQKVVRSKREAKNQKRPPRTTNHRPPTLSPRKTRQKHSRNPHSRPRRRNLNLNHKRASPAHQQKSRRPRKSQPQSPKSPKSRSRNPRMQHPWATEKSVV